MFHQSSRKIALNLSGHNIYLKRTTSAKTNTLRKPRETKSARKSKLDPDKIKYLQRIIFLRRLNIAKISSRKNYWGN